jgi:hypothetical protein
MNEVGVEPQPDPQNDQPNEQVLIIDGDEYDLGQNDLTFREQRDLRKLVRELTEDPELDPGDASLMDFLPALVTVIKRRVDPNFDVNTALDLKWEEVLRERPADPTPPPAAGRTSGQRGKRSSTP